MWKRRRGYSKYQSLDDKPKTITNLLRTAAGHITGSQVMPLSEARYGTLETYEAAVRPTEISLQV